jgi:hypothetical protein
MSFEILRVESGQQLQLLHLLQKRERKKEIERKKGQGM